MRRIELDKLREELDELKREVHLLKQRRVSQTDLINDAVKMRAMGEANRFIQVGLVADLPRGYLAGSSALCYFAKDTNTLYIYNGTAYVSEVFT